MTVGELKKALEGVPDDMLVSVENQGDDVVAKVARVQTYGGSHPGVWDDKTCARLFKPTFSVTAA